MPSAPISVNSESDAFACLARSRKDPSQNPPNDLHDPLGKVWGITLNRATVCTRVSPEGWIHVLLRRSRY